MVQGLPSWAFQVDATDLRCLRDPMMTNKQCRRTEGTLNYGSKIKFCVSQHEVKIDS